MSIGSCSVPELGASPTGPLFEHWIRRRVEFSDTDLSGIIHFSRYPVFMESAEHDFLRAIGTSVDVEVDGSRLGWPRLSLGFEFKKPVRFEDELDLRLLVLRKGSRSLTFGCEISHREELVARGQMSSACCIFEPGRPMRSVEIPPTIAECIAEVPEAEREAWQSPIRPL